MIDPIRRALWGAAEEYCAEWGRTPAQLINLAKAASDDAPEELIRVRGLYRELRDAELAEIKRRISHT